MSISITRYVDIISGIGGGAQAQTRDLVARMFTDNNLVPPQSFISFDTADEVGSYFGFSSEEYLRAVFYFSWISKNQTQAQSIQYARWVKTAATPLIIPVRDGTTAVADWTSITDGALILTMGGSTFTLSGLDFTGVASLADVAEVIQDAIRDAGSQTMTGTTNGTTSITNIADTSTLDPGMTVLGADIPVGATIVTVDSSTAITISIAATGSNIGESLTFNDPMWGAATVTYSATYGGFILTGGVAGVTTDPINVEIAGSGTDITPTGFLGWLPEQTNFNGNIVAGAVWSTGSAAETITETLDNSSNASTNFGSFAFMTNLGLTLQNVIDAATWNKSKNVLYMYSQAAGSNRCYRWRRVNQLTNDIL